MDTPPAIVTVATAVFGETNAFRNANMGGLAWAKLHDARVAAQLAARGWNGSTPVSNVGKLWMAGAPHGRAYLMGWRRKDGSWIQSGLTTPGTPGPHDDGHCDYSSLVVLVRKAA